MEACGGYGFELDRDGGDGCYWQMGLTTRMYCIESACMTESTP